MPITITSIAFKEGDSVPTQYTCDGANISPPLTWSGIPLETKSLALLMNDPDAPNGTFTHWVLYDLPRDTNGLPENVPVDETLANGARQCTNSFEKVGYGGPCPPPGHGSHRYFFRIFALDTELSLNKGSTANDLLNAIDGHVIDEGQLMGRYERARAQARQA